MRDFRPLLLLGLAAALVRDGIRRHRDEGHTDWRHLVTLLLAALASGGLAVLLFLAFTSSADIRSWRGALLVLGFMTAGSAAIGALIDVFLEFGIGRFPKTSVLPVAIGFGLGLACLAILAVIVQDSTGFELERTFLIAAGLFTLLCTITKPSWFWEHEKAQWLRDVLGDTGAAVSYYILGVALIAAALLVHDLKAHLTR